MDYLSFLGRKNCNGSLVKWWRKVSTLVMDKVLKWSMHKTIIDSIVNYGISVKMVGEEADFELKGKGKNLLGWLQKDDKRSQAGGIRVLGLHLTWSQSLTPHTVPQPLTGMFPVHRDMSKPWAVLGLTQKIK